MLIRSKVTFSFSSFSEIFIFFYNHFAKINIFLPWSFCKIPEFFQYLFCEIPNLISKYFNNVFSTLSFYEINRVFFFFFCDLLIICFCNQLIKFAILFRDLSTNLEIFIHLIFFMKFAISFLGCLLKCVIFFVQPFHKTHDIFYIIFWQNLYIFFFQWLIEENSYLI